MRYASPSCRRGDLDSALPDLLGLLSAPFGVPGCCVRLELTSRRFCRPRRRLLDIPLQASQARATDHMSRGFKVFLFFLPPEATLPVDLRKVPIESITPVPVEADVSASRHKNCFGDLSRCSRPDDGRRRRSDLSDRGLCVAVGGSPSEQGRRWPLLQGPQPLRGRIPFSSPPSKVLGSRPTPAAVRDQPSRPSPTADPRVRQAFPSSRSIRAARASVGV